MPDFVFALTLDDVICVIAIVGLFIAVVAAKIVWAAFDFFHEGDDDEL